MSNIEPLNRPSNLAELTNKLAQAKDTISNSRDKLKDNKKSPEKYIILKNGTLAETDHSQVKDKTILKETIG